MKTLLDFLSLTLLRKIEIRYRLINAFVLVSLLPLLITGVVAYCESTQAAQEKTRILVIDSRDGHVIADADQDSASGEQPSTALSAAIGKARANALKREVRSISDKIILIAVVCFLISVALSFIIARSISRPLRQLVAVMHEAKAGNYQIRMAHEGSDEISVLAERFNQMASKVHQHHEQLEQQVAERTQALELANQKLQEISATDSLTGIANRRRFDSALSSEMRRATRSQKPVGLLMVDVDFFKNYNDRYGHLAGDNCLRTVAQILHSHSRRATDTAARYGGEEFAVIVADCDQETAMQVAEQVRVAIAAAQIPHAASPFGHVTCSIGVAMLSVNDDTASDVLLRMADSALYLAKQSGRNQVVLNNADHLA